MLPARALGLRAHRTLVHDWRACLAALPRTRLTRRIGMGAADLSETRARKQLAGIDPSQGPVRGGSGPRNRASR